MGGCRECRHQRSSLDQGPAPGLGGRDGLDHDLPELDQVEALFAANPHVSIAYGADAMHPVYVDAVASWEDDLATKQRVWDLFRSMPEPVGYDPAPIFVAPDHENFGLLRLEPWKISLATLGGDPWMMVWTKDNGVS